MLKKENLDKTNAWPFVEAKKLLRERKSFIAKKGKIILPFFSIKFFLSRKSFFASTKGQAFVLSKFVFSITIYNSKISYIWRFY